MLERIRRIHSTEHGRVLLYRVWSRGYESRVLSALALATSGSTRQRWLRELSRLERQLVSEGWSYASSEAKNIEATLAWFAGDEAMKGAIRNGRPPNMPPFRDQFTDGALNVLVAYVRGLSGSEGKHTRPSDGS